MEGPAVQFELERAGAVDKVICHQVGAGHRAQVLEPWASPRSGLFHLRAPGQYRDRFLPLTAAIADQRQFLIPGDRVAFLGIGSGLNCLMLGWQW